MISKRLLATLAALAIPLAGWAQGTWPDRPVKLIVPFAPAA
jgi:tripartite-type tricarboxylate transporter receptor subunit TctC